MCNLTDVDDKIITRMARDGVTLKDLTGKYAGLFFDDLKALNIVPASRYPRATEHIDDIVEMVQVGGVFLGVDRCAHWPAFTLMRRRSSGGQKNKKKKKVRFQAPEPLPSSCMRGCFGWLFLPNS